MSEPSSDRPAGSSSATPRRRGPRRRQPAGYYIGRCGHPVPLVELGPGGGYHIVECGECCDDPPQ
ncbi:MAG: hypothetical protein ACRDRO_11640 [Pseudonocardiaceae bacterium]